MLLFFRHRGERLDLHDADVIHQRVGVLHRKLKPVDFAIDHRVVQTYHPGWASSPLRADLDEDPLRKNVVGPDFDVLILVGVVRSRQAQSGDLRLVDLLPPGVQRPRYRAKFPKRTVETSS